MRLIWGLWLLLIAVSFGVLEGYAITHDRATLSQFIWEASQAWPLLPFVIGMVVGGLAVHFWWRWTPKGYVNPEPGRLPGSSLQGNPHE